MLCYIRQPIGTSLLFNLGGMSEKTEGENGWKGRVE